MTGRVQIAGRLLSKLALLVAVFSTLASASVTLLLEEPYGKLGFFSPTGHAAVYLPDVCAESPLVLRKCKPGETGVVISRYNGVSGYDWVAIPLIPYLYAVEKPEDVPLFADAKMTAFLRDRYRRAHLEDVSPDKEDGSAPGGNWYELVGSSYDRTIYGFEIETTSKQDAALIRKLNASRNESHFHTVSKNCADFVKDILNFYYPRALHRSVVADLGMSTPKQMAKTLIRYSEHHPELQFSRIVIPQVPGSMPRSSGVEGVVEAFFKSKKYIVPSAVVSPIFAGCVAAVFVTTGGVNRFQPGRDATIFVVGGDPEKPLDREDVRAYQLQLKHLLAGTYPEKPGVNIDKSWEQLQSRADHMVDSKGRPVLQIPVGDGLVEVGASAGNILNGQPPSQLVRQLLEARLQSELGRRSSLSITESEVARDWKLLQQTLPAEPPAAAVPVNTHVPQRSESYRGN